MIIIMILVIIVIMIRITIMSMMVIAITKSYWSTNPRHANNYYVCITTC